MSCVRFAVIACGILLLFPYLAANADAPPIPSPDPSKTVPPTTRDDSQKAYARSRSWILSSSPRSDFDDLDINKALDLISDKSKEFDPAHTGFVFRVELPPGPFARLSGPQWEVSLHLKDAPLHTVLGDICYQDSAGWVISKKTIFLYLTYQPLLPDGTQAEVRPEKHLSRRMSAIIFPKINFKNEDIADAVDFLNKQNE